MFIKVLFALFLSMRVAIAADTPVPELRISANGSAQVEVVQGWPLLVHACVMNSARAKPAYTVLPVALAPSNGTWADAISFRVARGSQPGDPWPLQLATPPSQSDLNLVARAMGQVVFSMSGDATSAVVPGDYTMTADLTVHDGDGWHGTVLSAPITLHVVPAPDVLSPDQVLAHGILIAQTALLNGDEDGALDALAGVVNAQPGAILALRYIAEIMEQRDPVVAYALANRAVSEYKLQNATPAEAAFALSTLEARLREKAFAIQQQQDRHAVSTFPKLQH